MAVKKDVKKENQVFTSKTEHAYEPMKPTDKPENRYSDEEMPAVYKK